MQATMAARQEAENMMVAGSAVKERDSASDPVRDTQAQGLHVKPLHAEYVGREEQGVPEPARPRPRVAHVQPLSFVDTVIGVADVIRSRLKRTRRSRPFVAQVNPGAFWVA